MPRLVRPILAVAGFLLILILAGCGGSASTADTDPAAAGGIRLVSTDAGARLLDDPPDDLVVLDVRTPEEFAEGHLEGALLIDFYEADFAERLEGLDPTVPYLLYCRSGNRSGQTAEMMKQLGFADVVDVDGGINAWNAAGLATVTN